MSESIYHVIPIDVNRSVVSSRCLLEILVIPFHESMGIFTLAWYSIVWFGIGITIACERLEPRSYST